MSGSGRPPVRCVVFDAVGTTIEASPPVAEAYWAAGRRFGSRRGLEEIAARLPLAFEASEQGDLGGGEEGLVTSEQIEAARWRAIVEVVLDDVDDREACFQELFEHFGLASSWRCYRDVAGAVTAVRRKGFRFLVASNFDARLHDVCAGLAPLEDVDAIVVSSEVGCRKPGEVFYNAVVEAAGCAAEEVLMVGDDLENDVRGARRCGLQAVHLLRHGETVGEERRCVSLSELEEQW